ncbi:dynein regulatory complex protein 10 [Fundulus diaphanus]
MIPSRKLSPEAQRISNIVENCISQVEIAAALPSILQFHAASGVADEELSEILRAHQLLEKNSEIKQVERRLKELHMQIRHEVTFQEKQEEVNLTSLRDEVGSLKQETDQLSSQLSALMLENRKAERILQEKNDSVKIEIENILQSFDKDMLEIQAKLELTEQGYEKELEEVRKLKEPFSLLEEQYDVIQERKRLAEEKRKEEIRQLERKTKATIIIQAWWRGYSVRKALKSKAKKTKKAKKSKGKKTK